MVTLQCVLCYDCFSGGQERRRRRKEPGVSLFVCPLKHQQIPLLVHQLVQDGSPLVVSSGLHLMLHVVLVSLSLFHHHLTLILTKDGLRRVWLKHGQLRASVLYLRQGHTECRLQLYQGLDVRHRPWHSKNQHLGGRNKGLKKHQMDNTEGHS